MLQWNGHKHYSFQIHLFKQKYFLFPCKNKNPGRNFQINFPQGTSLRPHLIQDFKKFLHFSSFFLVHVNVSLRVLVQNEILKLFIRKQSQNAWTSFSSFAKTVRQADVNSQIFSANLKCNLWQMHNLPKKRSNCLILRTRIKSIRDFKCSNWTMMEYLMIGKKRKKKEINFAYYFTYIFICFWNLYTRTALSVQHEYFQHRKSKEKRFSAD